MGRVNEYCRIFLDFSDLLGKTQFFAATKEEEGQKQRHCGSGRIGAGSTG